MSAADDPGGAELDEFQAAERARRRRWLFAAGLAIVAIGAFVVVRRLTGLPPLDATTEREVREALPEIAKLPLDVRRSFAGQALAELEGERLPPALVEAFQEFGSVPPEFAELILLRAFEDELVRAAWPKACPAGFDALAEGAREGASATYRRCAFDRLDLLAESELAGVSLASMAASHLAWSHLVEHHADTDLERRLLRMLMLGE